MLIFSERGGATYSPAPFMKNYVRVLYRQPPHLSHPTPVTFSGQQLQFAALGEQSDRFVWSCHLYNRKDQDNQDKYRSIIIKINHAKQDYRMCHLRSSIPMSMLSYARISHSCTALPSNCIFNFISLLNFLTML